MKADPSKQIGLPYVAGSETSEAAAQGAKAKAATDRVKVIEYIRSTGDYGATADDVQVALGLTHQSGSARVSELWHKLKLIKLNGRKRRTRSGSLAGVYVAIDQADPCTGCGSPIARCGPELWAQQMKCCPDCKHPEHDGARNA